MAWHAGPFPAGVLSGPPKSAMSKFPSLSSGIFTGSSCVFVISSNGRGRTIWLFLILRLVEIHSVIRVIADLSKLAGICHLLHFAVTPKTPLPRRKTAVKVIRFGGDVAQGRRTVAKQRRRDDALLGCNDHIPRLLYLQGEEIVRLRWFRLSLPSTATGELVQAQFREKECQRTPLPWRPWFA